MKTNSFFIHTIQLSNCDTGWVLSYLDDLYLDFFQTTQNALLRWLLHLHSNFHLIPPSGLPCGSDKVRPYFTQIIGHNSVNVHRDSYQTWH